MDVFVVFLFLFLSLVFSRCFKRGVFSFSSYGVFAVLVTDRPAVFLVVSSWSSDPEN